MGGQERTPDFAKPSGLDALLRQLNAALPAAEEQLDLPDTPRRPILMIVGPPRSGTTLLLQWLASSGRFGYPSNLIARFYGAPAVGARVQQLLFDPAYDYRREMALDGVGVTEMSSDYGKTSGPLQPHEFFYYWRRFVDIDQGSKLSPDQIARADGVGFRSGWAHLEAVFDRPLACKALLLQYDIALLAEWLPTAVFLHVERDVVMNADSLLGAREAVLGDEDHWFSVRPPGHERLLDRPAHEQVLGQVELTNAWIRRSLEELPAHRSIHIGYEQFCSDPAAFWARLASVLAVSGESIGDYDGPASFRSRDRSMLDPAVRARLERTRVTDR